MARKQPAACPAVAKRMRGANYSLYKKISKNKKKPNFSGTQVFIQFIKKNCDFQDKKLIK